VKRLAAVVAAVAMVAGAWALRQALTGDDRPAAPGDVPEQLRLTCATELAAVCDALDVDGLRVAVEDPGRTADRIAQLPAGEDPGFDAWLVDGPWAAMVADDRAFAGVDGDVVDEPSGVLGRSPAVVVVQASRQDALTAACGGTITWRCIGEQAGSYRVGLTAPDRGDGLVPLAEATASWFGTTEYSSVDFEDPGFTAWFDALTELSAGGRINLGARSALATAVSQAGTFNVVGALESQSATLLRGREDWATLYPEPMSTADVQLVPRTGLDAGELLDRIDRTSLTGALADQGWRTDGGRTDRAVALPDGTGLPSAGVLNALRDQW
jgi:hypothetical protein